MVRGDKLGVRLLAVGLGLAIAAAVVAGCGDSTDESTSAAESTTSGAESTAAAGAGETVEVSETDFALDPSEVSVKPGTVTFDVSNDGEATHNLEVEGPDGEEELSSDLQPGDAGELTVDLTEPGTYEMYCPVDGHKEMGMTGEITVEG